MYDFSIQTNQGAERLENMQQSDKASQTSLPEGFRCQNSGIVTELIREKHSENGRVIFLNFTKKWPTETQETDKHTTDNRHRDEKIFPSHNYTPEIKEKLMRVENTIEIYLPVFSMKIQKR